MFLQSFSNNLLRFTCQLQRVERDAFGTTSVTTTSTVRCFAYSGVDKAVAQGLRETRTFDWTVLLPTSATSLVALDDIVNNVVDSAGNVIIQKGDVKHLTSFGHWREGAKVLVALVNRHAGS